MTTLRSAGTGPDYFLDRRRQPQPPRLPQLNKTSKARRNWTVLALLVYVGLALFSWVSVSIQNFRPIAGTSYSWDNLQELSQEYDSGDRDALYAQNDQYFQASRIITTILAVTTVPLVLVICSAMKNTYVRRNRQSMRQAIAITDHHRGPFLFFTMTLCMLGGLVYILQLVLVSTQDLYTPDNVSHIFRMSSQLSDIAVSLDGKPITETAEDTSNIAAILRNSLSATSNADPLSMLWQENITCSVGFDTNQAYPAFPDTRQSLCTVLGNNLQYSLESAFVSSIAYGYNTGLVRQFAPRLNSSTTYEEVTTFPACEGNSSWSRRYTNSTGSPGNFDLQSFDMEICMPETISSFRNIQERQDINEVLYMRMSMDQGQAAGVFNPFNNYTIKVSLNTTAGYFELPNYMNDQQPGPLLPGSPRSTCGVDCYEQSWQEFPVSDQENISVGPLSRIANALFGNNSVLDILSQNPQGFRLANVDRNAADLDQATQTLLNTCVLFLPLARLMDGDVRNDTLGEKYCIYYYDQPIGIATDWILNFVNNTQNMKTTFDASAAIANDIWLNSRQLSQTYTISRDFGVQHSKPVIALPSLIIISLLLGVFLITLSVAGIYSCVGRSTNTLNSFFMVKLGAMNYRRLGDPNPAVVAAALDEIPGWVEDDKVIITDDMELN